MKGLFDLLKTGLVVIGTVHVVKILMLERYEPQPAESEMIEQVSIRSISCGGYS